MEFVTVWVELFWTPRIAIHMCLRENTNKQKTNVAPDLEQLALRKYDSTANGSL